MTGYEELLKKAKKELPEVKAGTERFEIPKVKGHVEGNKTIILNFFQICDLFGRDPQQVLKYLQRELAVPAGVDGQRLILNRKLSSSFVNQKIEQYAKDFVICKECGKPDTKIVKEDRVSSLQCMACGAKYPIRAKII
ncbi:MAG: translation initiation factor IF-2 subunit beta [Candidatus Nanoarchaeia archaeon]|nr:translation initiation factor IF-2 subunit beta [Candidatus Nanoarchaeia archaeon]